jgi:hypothetical protein
MRVTHQFTSDKVILVYLSGPFLDAIRPNLCMSGELEDGESKKINLLNGIVCFRTCNLVECFVRWGVKELYLRYNSLL